MRIRSLISGLCVIALAGFAAAPAHAATVPVFDWVAPYVSTGVDTAFTKGVVVNSAADSVWAGNRFSGSSIDLNPFAGEDFATSSGSFDALLAAFSQDGEYVASKWWGSTGSDNTQRVSVDGSGNVYAAGGFVGTVDFDPGGGSTLVSASSGTDVFVSKFSPDGTFEWVRGWGGTGSDGLATAPVFDSAGNFLITGAFPGTVDFDPGAGTTFVTSAGSNDSYISKFSSDGTFQWVKTFGGTGFDSPSAPRVDSADNFFVTGVFSGTVDFDPGVGEAFATSSGSFDVHLSKFSSDGTFQWVKTFGGTGADFSTGLSPVFSDDGVVIFGSFAGTVDFDPGAGDASVAASGASDIFVVKFSSDGTFQWVKTFGGSAGDEFLADYIMEPDDDDTFFVIGAFKNTVDFDPGAGTANKTSAGGSDVFISQFDSDGDWLLTRTFGGSADEWPDYASTGELNGVPSMAIIGPYKSAPTDFDPSGGTAEYSSDGNDMYVVVYSLVEPAITITVADDTASEDGDTASYSVVLAASPDDAVVVTITPDSQLSVSTSSISFSTSTWDTPQTVTVIAVDDGTIEGVHSGGITHSVSSNDALYDGITADSVTVTITDNEHSSTSSSRRFVVANAVQTVAEVATPPLTPEERAIRIAEIRTTLISLIKEAIALLQAEVAKLL